MDQRTYDHAIRTLHKLRDGYKGQLDTCIAAELDDVITELEKVSIDHRDRMSQELRMRILRVIGMAMFIVNNLRDLFD